MPVSFECLEFSTGGISSEYCCISQQSTKRSFQHNNGHLSRKIFEN